MTNEVERIAAMRDRFELLRKATNRMSAAQEEVTELAVLRRRVIQELHDMGLSYAEIGQQIGLTRGRIHQIRHSGPPLEGGFLGLGKVVIVTPAKEEGARAVVAADDMTGAQRLGELARHLGLVPSFESMPPGGEVDLDRSNLVVICGPGDSQPVAGVLAQDPNVGFEQGGDGAWTLVDRRTGTVYRSGQGEETTARHREVAYLGRLPRPDGGGSLVVLSGLGGRGLLGAVELLCTRISDLYGEVRTNCFSVLVGTDYDAGSPEPASVELLTPLYRMQPA